MKNLIALSGIDGSGKSTQIELLEDYFKKQEKSVIYLWTRGGNTNGINFLKFLARKIAGKKLPPSGHSARRDEIFKNSKVQKAWLILGIIDLIRIYAFMIRFWTLSGRIVICDRYLWDTFIDFSLNFPDVDFESWKLWKFLVWSSPKAHKSFLLMIPIEISEKRCLEKFEPFPDSPEQRKRRHELYSFYANKDYWQTIDSTNSISSVFEAIKASLNS